MPKRIGHIYEKIVDMDNLRAADKEAQAGKVKKNRYIRRHNLRAEEDLQELQQMLLTFSCVPGKGIHYGVKRLKMMLRRYPEYRFFWKADYKKYYQSIPHDVAMAAFRRKFKDEKFLKLMDMAIFNYDSGQVILDMLDDEQRKRSKRHAHRRLSQSDHWQFCSEPSGPSHEGEDALQVLSPVL